MPLYTYYCQAEDKGLEKNAPIADRDSQWCEDCGHRLIRAIDAPGGVYAPTAGKGLAV
jgi:putative FmdB family regulatory protein